MDDVVRYTRICPNCGNKLGFSSNQSTVHCQCCESDFSLNELLRDTGLPTASSGFAAANIDNVESGLAYLDSVFGTLDWTDFCTNEPSLFVESVTAVVEKMKVKYANSPVAWLFEFKSIMIPLMKRFEFMDEMIAAIADAKIDLEDEEVLTQYDCYCLSIELLLNGKEYIRKALEIDLRFMKQFKVEASTYSACEKEYKDVLKKLDELKESKSIYDLECVQVKSGNKEKELIEHYANRGIRVEEVYKAAMQEYLFGEKSKALHSFESIAEYRDCDKYIRKLKTVYYPFGGKFLEFGDSIALLCGNTPDAVNQSGCSGKKASVTESFTNTKLREIRHIVDGVKAERPILKKVDRIIMGCGNNLYYVDGENYLCKFEFQSGINTRLMSLKGCKLDDASLKRYPSLGKFLFLSPCEEKRIESSGCSGKKSKEQQQQQQQQQAVPQVARYALSVVDCYDGTIHTFEGDILSITDRFDEYVFFTKGIFNGSSSLVDKAYFIYNVATGKSISPFNREVIVYNVMNGYIIYGIWQPNGYNIDIYSYHMDDKVVTLLEKNSFGVAMVKRWGVEYPLTIDGYVYYTVGNDEFSPLYRVKPDGTDRKEIMANVETVNFVRNGYFYITKAHPFWVGGKVYYERSLIRAKADGSSRTYICGGFSRIIQFKQGFIYYVDDIKNLHIVRADGEKDRIISSHFEKELLINEKNIFFVYGEYVGEDYDGKVGDEYGKSIYMMDLQGHNLHKVAFNVEEAEFHDENNIYYSVNDILSFEVQMPINKNDYSKPEIKDYRVTVYYALNVNDLNLTRIYVENHPQFGAVEQKGCGKSKSSRPILARPVQHIYPMPSKTRLTFVERAEKKVSGGLSSIVGGVAGGAKGGNSTQGCGCSPKKK